MNIFVLIKKSFQDAIINPVVSLFLVLFLLLSIFITSYASMVRNPIISLVISLCALLLTICFISGWFQIIKDIVLDNEKKDKNYIPIFFEGVGKNIIPVIIGGIIYTILWLGLFFVAGKLSIHFFGNLNFLLSDLSVIPQTKTSLLEYFNNLSDAQKYSIYATYLVFILTSTIYNFAMFFYFPAIFFQEKENIFKNAFVSLINSWKFLFKNFFPSLLIFLLIYLTYFTLGIFKTFFAHNQIISFLLTFIYICFICVSVMLVFNYYGQKNCSVDGCNCIRENENINKSSEED